MALVDPISKEKFLPLIFKEVPEEFRLKANIELNETKENVDKGLEILRECIRRENLPFSIEENFLMLFLRPAKFDFKKAEKKLIRFQKFWKKFEEMVASTSIEKMRAVIDSQIVGLLPFRDQHGRAVFHARANFWNKELFNIDDAATCMIGLCIFAALYPLTSICGIAYIDDCYIDNIFDFYPLMDGFRRYIHLLNWTPMRYSRVDFVNEPAICRFFFKVIKQFLPDKFKNRIFFHGPGVEVLRKIYHPSMLPHEFGGTLGPLSPDSYKENFFAFVEKIKFEFKHTKEIKFDI